MNTPHEDRTPSASPCRGEIAAYEHVLTAAELDALHALAQDWTPKEPGARPEAAAAAAPARDAA